MPRPHSRATAPLLDPPLRVIRRTIPPHRQTSRGMAPRLLALRLAVGLPMLLPHRVGSLGTVARIPLSSPSTALRPRASRDTACRPHRESRLQVMRDTALPLRRGNRLTARLTPLGLHPDLRLTQRRRDLPVRLGKPHQARALLTVALARLARYRDLLERLERLAPNAARL